MDRYGQDPELRLLGLLVPLLSRRTAIDVGAERGALSAGLLEAGIEELHAIEPHPDNARALREALGDDRRVTVHEYAAGDRDGKAQLHLSVTPAGEELPFGHTLLDRHGTDEIRWRGSVEVACRSLASLVDEGALPAQVGILKIDTEGNDLAVLRGMGSLRADVVMVEHWSDLPNGLGRCPWSEQDLLEELRPRGFGHFAFVVHRGEFVTAKWDDAEVETGAMGNLVFLHDTVVDALLPALVRFAGMLAEEAVAIGLRNERTSEERSAVIEGLKQAADERLELIRELDARAAERLSLLEQARAEIDALRQEPAGRRRPVEG
jgi:FkbM family methyltransferase